MNFEKQLAEHLLSMRGSTLHNYIIPGMSSHLLTNGLVRMFEASREQLDEITPHSHRFDFLAYVVRGQVRNRIWKGTIGEPGGEPGDEFIVSELAYGKSPGNYTQDVLGTGLFSFKDYTYDEGEWYGMTSDQIHSIRFSRDALVLFFEGPEKTNKTRIIEPYAGGQHCATLQTPKWMFVTDTTHDWTLPKPEEA